MFAHGVKRRKVLEEREHEGYFYTVNKTLGNTLYLECKDKKLKQCNATASVVDGQIVVRRAHSHPIDDRIRRIQRFKGSLYVSVTSSLREHRVIYDEMCVRDPTAAIDVPFVSVEQSMVRWRRDTYPPIPNTLTRYTEFLGMEVWEKFLVYDGGRLNVAAVHCVDGFTSVVFGDIGFLRGIVTARIHVDATFAVCPRKPRVLQLLTIMAEIDDAILPITWALMTRKTYNAYVAVFHHFSTILAPHIRPASFMTDFEQGLAAALQTTYPEAIAERCYFHYCQALMKTAKRFHLMRRILACDLRKILFRKIMALALLPARDITAAFQWIVAHVPLDIARDFARFFRYFENYWLHRVTPQLFSVFGLQCKTNNATESYHRVLRVRMGVHPSIWEFTENLHRLQVVVYSSVGSLNHGLGIRGPSVERQMVQQQLLWRAWELYEEHLLDAQRFLACASNLLKAFSNEHLIVNAAQIENFANPALNDVEDDRDHLDPVLFEEDLENLNVLRRELDGRGIEIVILPGLVFQLCRMCNANLMDTISLPCCHWIACFTCTARVMLLAARGTADVRCSICGAIARGFHRIIVRE